MRSSLKKVICVALSAVMIFAMSVTAFAADSPVAIGVVTAGNGVDKNGGQVRFRLRAYSGNFASAVADIQTTEGLKAAMGNAYVDGLQVVDVQTVTVEDADIAYPVQLTFNVPGVTAGTKVAVMAYVNGQWVMLQCTAGNGTITVTFENADQLALVAFAVDKSVASSATGAVSPKTGENSVVPMAVIAMALMVGGSLCLRKREVR